MDEATVRSRLREWIARKSGKVTADQLSDSLPILEQRILSSLHVAELLLYIAELRDRAIDVESLRPGVFRDVDTIYKTFFAGRGDA